MGSERWEKCGGACFRYNYAHRAAIASLSSKDQESRGCRDKSVGRGQEVSHQGEREKRIVEYD